MINLHALTGLHLVPSLTSSSGLQCELPEQMVMLTRESTKGSHLTVIRNHSGPRLGSSVTELHACRGPIRLRLGLTS